MISDNIQIILLVLSLILILIIFTKVLKLAFKIVIIIVIIYFLFKIFNPFSSLFYFQNIHPQHELQFGTINYNHSKTLIDYYLPSN